ncbi:hypothetical protein D9757_007430 [Collybiopsis confluens]|uniref:Uncharacterized protein n=1 Tax=Collybiopsis confluens TaxID=2823264 RepID=A0A8H5M7R6_9AGAR|nr:hypothetical protein D9757_007430 [Collybiopsis confluens]
MVELRLRAFDGSGGNADLSVTYLPGMAEVFINKFPADHNDSYDTRPAMVCEWLVLILKNAVDLHIKAVVIVEVWAAIRWSSSFSDGAVTEVSGCFLVGESKAGMINYILLMIGETVYKHGFTTEATQMLIATSYRDGRYLIRPGHSVQ